MSSRVTPASILTPTATCLKRHVIVKILTLTCWIRQVRLFRNGTIRVLVSTDVASRGIDVPETKVVINCTVPRNSSDYVHRIGRTGRAKNSGIAISFCNIEERPYLRDIQKLIDLKIPVVTKHPFADEVEELPTKKAKGKKQKKHIRTESRSSNTSVNKSNNRKSKSSDNGVSGNRNFNSSNSEKRSTGGSSNRSGNWRSKRR